MKVVDPGMEHSSRLSNLEFVSISSFGAMVFGGRIHTRMVTGGFVLKDGWVKRAKAVKNSKGSPVGVRHREECVGETPS